MPLNKSGSKNAFGANVATEMHAGKPQKQALAIAYSTQRHPGGGVKYLRKAAGGYPLPPTGPATAAPPGTDTGGALDPTTGMLADPAFADLLKRAQVIKTIQDLQPQPSAPIAPPVGDILGEQRLRSQAVANSAGPNQDYNLGFQPGGLMDSFGSFINQWGGNAPRLETGARQVNRVPFDTLGGGDFGTALDLANQVVSNAQRVPGVEPSGPVADNITSLLKDLSDYAAGKKAPSAAESSVAADSSLTGPKYAEFIRKGNAAGVSNAGLANGSYSDTVGKLTPYEMERKQATEKSMRDTADLIDKMHKGGIHPVAAASKVAKGILKLGKSGIPTSHTFGGG